MIKIITMATTMLMKKSTTAFMTSFFLQLSRLTNVHHINLSLLHQWQHNSIVANAFSTSNCHDPLKDSPFSTFEKDVELCTYSYPKSQSNPDVVFQDENIVAVSKPQGLSCYGKHPVDFPDTPPSSQRQSTKPSSEQPLVKMLPSISRQLGIEKLDVGLSLKSYYSGLVLLTKTPSSTEKLQKVLSGASSQKDLHLTYLAIAIGKPQCEMHMKKEIYLERQYLHGREMSLVSNKSISSARKEGKMIQTAFSLNVIANNDNTVSSLVEVKISKDKWDAIPVLLSHFLSPVLGDNVYSSRTNFLMGVPVPALPHTAFPGKQRLPSNTKNVLQDHFKLGSSPLPVFLHRHKVTLNNFQAQFSPPYEITAPLPTYFTTALDCLGLQFNSGK